MILHLDTLLLLLHLRRPLFLGLDLNQGGKVKEKKLCLWPVIELERKKVGQSQSHFAEDYRSSLTRSL